MGFSASMIQGLYYCKIANGGSADAFCKHGFIQLTMAPFTNMDQFNPNMDK